MNRERTSALLCYDNDQVQSVAKEQKKRVQLLNQCMSASTEAVSSVWRVDFARRAIPLYADYEAIEPARFYRRSYDQ